MYFDYTETFVGGEEMYGVRLYNRKHVKIKALRNTIRVMW